MSDKKIDLDMLQSLMMAVVGICLVYSESKKTEEFKDILKTVKLNKWMELTPENVILIRGIHKRTTTAQTLKLLAGGYNPQGEVLSE